MSDFEFSFKFEKSLFNFQVEVLEQGLTTNDMLDFAYSCFDRIKHWVIVYIENHYYFVDYSNMASETYPDKIKIANNHEPIVFQFKNNRFYIKNTDYSLPKFHNRTFKNYNAIKKYLKENKVAIKKTKKTVKNIC